LKRYVDAAKEQAGIDIRFQLTGSERRLESYQEVMVFRAIQELINNAVRHSQANQVKAQLDLGEISIKASVDDDGKGFDVDTLEQKSGMGLKIIRDRVEMLGGTFDLDTAIGRGTRVVFTIPAAGPRS
jgi:two-component system sensor histidine kinase DegS